MSVIIGIDLGTSTTEAAIYRDGKPEMILNMEGEAITPSFIGIDQFGSWVVGERARAQFLLYPERTAMEVKRKIGTQDMIPLGSQKYNAVTLSAKILEYVKHYATEKLGEEVTRAVISVPAYFDNQQRQETMQAGRLAGLTVERILNEPTAAALSYGLDHMEEESHILVYDLGGGTFDVTLLEMFEGVLDVKASSGDNTLGGKDFDQKLVDKVLGLFSRNFGVDLSADKFAMVKIRDEAENCKKALSKEDSYRILIPMITKKGDKPLDIDITITRKEFEDMTQDLMARTHKPIDTVLADAHLSASEIDKIILVGGSTRMPMVAKDIEQYLHMQPEEAVNPDLAVAQGAAIQAGILAGSIDQDEGIMITDVNPYTLGIRTVDGFLDFDHMSVVIPRNVTIPSTRSEVFYTHFDYQTEANVEVYQGESEKASENRFLGNFLLGGIPPKKAQKESILVEFSYDLNGMLNVKATVVSTGNEASIDIDMHGHTDGIPEAEGSYSAETKKSLEGWKDVEGSEGYRTIIRRMERMLKNAESEEDQMRQISLGAMYDAIREAIVEEDWERADEVKDSFLRLLEEME